MFIGTRHAIFCYASQRLGRYVDVDEFKYEIMRVRLPLDTRTAYACKANGFRLTRVRVPCISPCTSGCKSKHL